MVFLAEDCDADIDFLVRGFVDYWVLGEDEIAGRVGASHDWWSSCVS